MQTRTFFKVVQGEFFCTLLQKHYIKIPVDTTWPLHCYRDVINVGSCSKREAGCSRSLPHAPNTQETRSFVALSVHKAAESLENAQSRWIHDTLCTSHHLEAMRRVDESTSTSFAPAHPCMPMSHSLFMTWQNKHEGQNKGHTKRGKAHKQHALVHPKTSRS